MKTLDKKYQSLLLLVGAAMAIMIFAPREQKFKYSFLEGKPWRYDLLTAPYSFPIYKNALVLEAEQDSVRKTIKPFYDLNKNIGQEMPAEWKQDFDNTWSSKLSKDYYIYIRDFLENVYSKGVISEDQLTRLRERNFLEINLLSENKIPKSYPIGLLYNVKEAYLLAIDNVPQGIDPQVVKEIDPAKYLKENVLPNEVMTAQVTQEELKKIPNSTGIVQKDQRIIDKGEIVSPEVYNVLQSYKQVHESKTGFGSALFGYMAGIFFLVLILLGAVWLFWVNFRPGFFVRLKNSVFIVTVILIFVILTELIVPLVSDGVYIIPYVILPIIIRPFFRSRMAFFVHLITVLLSSLFVPFPLEFIILQLAAGQAAIFSLRTLNSRAQLIRATFLVFLTYVVTMLCTSLMQNGNLEEQDLIQILLLGINFIFLMFSYTLVYPVEKLFGYVSNISLVELSDVNTPLLRQLSESAPGTFQHSMQVSILASEAAARIGADAQLIRTGALYHDIGKMLNPSYFTENQGALNPHENLSLKESAAAIIKHVTDGVMLAQKHNLPKTVIDFILTHHGEGRVKYFYTLYCNEHLGEVVDPSPFTYPGPNPSTREQGILMLADCVEAASRSIKEYTQENISELVNHIIDNVLKEKLLDNTPLTFKDITDIKEVFIDKLRTIYHSRIEYPKATGGATTKAPSITPSDNEIADKILPLEREEEL